jgi:methionyl aminopeptidase
MIQIKTRHEVELMRRAGLVVGETLALLTEAVRPGISTGELDALAEQHIRGSGAVPSFLGYGVPPFPATICASVNDEIVHGIPGARVLAEGDVISIDCGAIVDGWHGDAAVTVPVGAVPDEVAELLEVTEDALWSGLAAVRLGGRLTDVGHAVESSVRARGDFGIVEEYVGHGIGTEMHQAPNVSNVGRAGRGPELVEGLVVAIEPMVNLGSRYTRLLDDEWTVATQDGRWSAHFEHTVAVTPEGPWVLTALDGGAARLGTPARS